LSFVSFYFDTMQCRGQNLTFSVRWTDFMKHMASDIRCFLVVHSNTKHCTRDSTARYTVVVSCWGNSVTKKTTLWSLINMDGNNCRLQLHACTLAWCLCCSCVVFHLLIRSVYCIVILAN